MLSKNFLEDKRTNQKNLFERDPHDMSKASDGRALNCEELIESLKQQLAELDFPGEVENAERYEVYYQEEGEDDEFE